MNRYTLYIAFILVLMISCKPSKKNNEIADILASQDTQEVKISSIGTTLSPLAKRKISGWLEYEMLQSKMEGYYKTTKSQALQNAIELANLIKNVSDTIDIKKLDRPDVKIRFNVLRNYALRLDDMSTIPSITEEEVMQEVANVLDAFSALNEKINAIYKIEEYEKELNVVDGTKKISKPTISDFKTAPEKKNNKKVILNPTKRIKRPKIKLSKKINLKKQ